MVFRSVIGFEDDPPEDVVSFAVAPIDAFTGRIVQRNVKASVTVAGETADSEELKLKLPDKPIRNRSGLLVFINLLPDHPKYRVHVKARAAGYFDPEPTDFTPPKPDDDYDPKDRLRLDFPLFPRPDFAFAEEVTLVSGVVVETKGVEGARITEVVEGARILVVIPPPNEGLVNRKEQTFETRSDERGAFALALRLPVLDSEERSDVEDRSNKGVPVKFRIETREVDDDTTDGKQNWELALQWDRDKEIKIIEGRRHVFRSPLNLSNPDKLSRHYRITKKSLEKLNSKDVPDNVLKKLKGIANQEIVGEKKFLDSLEATIGGEQTVQYESDILKYAKLPVLIS